MLHRNRRSFKQGYQIAVILPAIVLLGSLSVGVYDLAVETRAVQAELANAQLAHRLVRTSLAAARLRGLDQRSDDPLVASQLRQAEVGLRSQLGDLQFSLPAGGLAKAPLDQLVDDYRAPPTTKAALERFSWHTGRVQQLLSLTRQLAYGSTHGASASSSAHYAKDLTFVYLPDLAEAVGQVRGLGSGYLGSASNGELGSSPATPARSIHDLHSAATLMSKRAALEPSDDTLRAGIQKVTAQADAYASRVGESTRELARPNATAASRTFAEGTAIIDEIDRLSAHTHALLENILGARLASLRWRMALIVLGGLGVLGLTLYFTLRFYASNRSALELLALERDQAAIYLKTAQVGLMALDTRGRIAMMNPQGYSDFGYANEAEALGRDFFQECVPVGEQEAFRRWFRAVLDDTSDGPTDYEDEVPWGVDPRQALAMRGTALKDAAGVPQGILLSMMDISDRKRAEQLQDQLVSSVSHELRTPLTSIRGALTLVVEGVAGPVSTPVKELLDLASRNTLRLIRLVNNILDIKKLESGKLVSHKMTVDICPVIEQTVRDCEILARENNVELDFGQCQPDLRVLADPESLSQVVTNLVSNAIKHSPTCAMVKIHCKLRGEWLRVSVEDQGLGVPEDFRPYLFEPFSQHLGPGSPRKIGSTGLGLSIAKAIIEDHEGCIGYEPDPDGGSHFFFELPLLQASSP